MTVCSSWTRLAALLLLIPGYVSAEPLSRSEVPLPLKPWVEWVLRDEKDASRSFVQTRADHRQCVWPSRLHSYAPWCAYCYAACKVCSSILERLTLPGDLEAQGFRWHGCARVAEVVYDIGDFLEPLTGLEDLRRLPIDLQHDRAFHDVDEPGCRVGVSARRGPRGDLRDQHVRFLALHSGHICLQNFAALERSLRTEKLASDYAQRDADSEDQAKLDSHVSARHRPRGEDRSGLIVEAQRHARSHVDALGLAVGLEPAARVVHEKADQTHALVQLHQ